MLGELSKAAYAAWMGLPCPDWAHLEELVGVEGFGFRARGLRVE